MIKGLRIGAVDGLKLRFTGEEVRALLDERIDAHRQRAERWEREQARTPEEETEEAPLLPDHLCEHEATRYRWRVERLEFIREHVDGSAEYLLSEADLQFAELLPQKPGSLQQEEYEERTGVAFNLERLTKRLGEITPMRAFEGCLDSSHQSSQA